MSNEAVPEPNAAPTPSLQFDQVELPTGAATKLCGLCGTTIADIYFEAGGRVLCPACSDKISGKAGGVGAFPRAALFGAGAALLGTIVWGIIMKVADMELGIVAVAVGYAVGMAVNRGSRGRGGWKYQALAMFLSYASICTSYVPMIVKGVVSASDEAKKKDADAAKTTDASKKDEAKDETKQPVTVVGVLVAIVLVFGLAFAAPFLAGLENVMGILIIAIALYEAWKLNRKVVVAGPFRMAAEAAPPVAATGTP